MQLAADLRRFLRFEPVQALPARTWRSARLFARRHTGPAVAGLLALAVAAAGVTALGVGLVRANDSAKEARQANRAAQQQAQRAARMAHFLEATLFGADPEERGPHASFFDAIDYAAGRVHRDLADVPEVEADVRFSLGFVYRRHGLYAKATDQLRAALHIRERVLGERDPRTLEVIEELGFLAYAHTGDFDAAALLLGRALETHEQAGRADSESAAWLCMKLGLVRLAQDDLRAAEALFERSRGPLEREYGSAYASRPMRELARCALRGGDAARAESLAREALRRCATAEEQEYIAARVRLTLAEACLATGKLDEADAIARDAQEALRKLLPETHPEVADLELVLARLERARGDASRARTHADKSLQMRRALLDARHPAILEAEVALAEIAVRSGADTPVPDLPRLFERAETELGADHWLTIEVLRVIHAHAAAAGDDSAVRRHAATLARLAQRRAERLAAQ